MNREALRAAVVAALTPDDRQRLDRIERLTTPPPEPEPVPYADDLTQS